MAATATLRALRLVAERARSRSELALRLGRAGYPEGEVEAACKRLDELGYLDDRRLAQDEALRLGARLAAAAVEARLLARGLDAQLVRSAVAPLRAGEEALARRLVLDRFGTAPLDRAASLRAARWLAGRGFGEELVARLLGL